MNKNVQTNIMWDLFVAILMYFIIVQIKANLNENVINYELKEIQANRHMKDFIIVIPLILPLQFDLFMFRYLTKNSKFRNLIFYLFFNLLESGPHSNQYLI